MPGGLALPAAAEPPPLEAARSPPLGAARPAALGGRSALLVTLPNLISLARLCAVPATLWLIFHGQLDWAFGLFVAAGISDGVDGWLARVRNARSALGAVLDPLADKALLVSVYIALASVGVLPDWLAMLVVFRDLMIVGGFLTLAVLGLEPVAKPLWISKLNTVLQIALAALALAGAGLDLAPEWLALALAALPWAVAASTLGSGGAYAWGLLHRGPA